MAKELFNAVGEKYKMPSQLFIIISDGRNVEKYARIMKPVDYRLDVRFAGQIGRIFDKQLG